MHLDTNYVEVVFVAKLPALSSSKFNVFICSDEQDTKTPSQSDGNKAKPKEKTLIYCLRCPSKISSSSALRTEAFDVDKLPNDMIQLENSNSCSIALSSHTNSPMKSYLYSCEFSFLQLLPGYVNINW